jgi:hypothetical protein
VSRILHCPLDQADFFQQVLIAGGRNPELFFLGKNKFKERRNEIYLLRTMPMTLVSEIDSNTRQVLYQCFLLVLDGALIRSLGKGAPFKTGIGAVIRFSL